MTSPNDLFWMTNVAAALVIVVLIYKALLYGSRPKGYPPGPPTVPIIGNIHLFPSKDLHLQYQKWTKEYGPIVSVKLGSQTLILLGTATAVKDLLEKRSSIYSSRMDTFFRYFGPNLGIALRSNDDVWRKMRRVYHTRLNVKAADNYLPYISLESVGLLHDMLDNPKDLTHVLERYTTSIGSTIAFGKRVSSTGDPTVRKLDDWFLRQVTVIARVGLADFFPFLRPFFKYAPPKINSLRKDLEALAEVEDDMWKSLARRTREILDRGKVYPSFMRDMLMKMDAGEKDGLTPEQARYNAGHAWAAATDTQSNTLRALVKAMVMYPNVQKEAQREIDELVGTERLPTWDDRAKLPYLRGCIEETLRWMPATITGGPMPHCVTVDDEYMGYKIPAGAGVVNCVWTINNDENEYPNPREFNPLRFKAEESAIDGFGISTDSNITRPHFTFGAGRRVCPGFYAAERDAQGRPIYINRDELTEGVVVGPAPYEYEIEPRDEQRVAMIKEQFCQASQNLGPDGNYTEEFFKESWTSKLA